MRDESSIPWITQAIGKALGDAQPLFDLAQQQPPSEDKVPPSILTMAFLPENR